MTEDELKQQCHLIITQLSMLAKVGVQERRGLEKHELILEIIEERDGLKDRLEDVEGGEECDCCSDCIHEFMSNEDTD